MQILITYSDLHPEKMLNLDVLHCLHTLQWQFDKKDIKVYRTPPTTDDKFKEHISQFCTIVEKPNYTITYPPNLPQYQDRFWITDIQDEQAIYADADIEFSQRKKISDLFTHDFDICGVPDAKWVADIKELLAGHILLYDNHYQRTMQPFLQPIADRLITNEIPHFDYDRIFDEYIVTYVAHKCGNFKPKYIPYELMPWNPFTGDDHRRVRQYAEDAYILHGGGRKTWRAGNPAYVHDTISERLYPLLMENKETIIYKHTLERLVAALLTLIEEDNPDVDVWCDYTRNGKLRINFWNIETIPKLLQKFNYLWDGWLAQVNQAFGDFEISFNDTEYTRV